MKKLQVMWIHEKNLNKILSAINPDNVKSIRSGDGSSKWYLITFFVELEECENCEGLIIYDIFSGKTDACSNKCNSKKCPLCNEVLEKNKCPNKCNEIKKLEEIERKGKK